MTKRRAPSDSKPITKPCRWTLRSPLGSVERLPRPARRILAAARGILRERGFGALSLRSVANDAGQHKPAIAYYFGNKAGLVFAIVEAIILESIERSDKGLSDLPDGAAKVAAFLENLREFSMDRDATLEYLEILPSAVRSRDMGPAMRDLYARSRDFNAQVFRAAGDDCDPDRRVPLATLTEAVFDGLAMQKAVGVEDDLIDDAWAEWGRLLLAEVLHEDLTLEASG